MKKKKVIILIILIVLAVLAILGYKIFFNGIVSDEKSAIDNEVGQVTEEILEEIQKARDATLKGESGIDLDNQDLLSENTEGDGTEGNGTSVKATKILALYNAGFSKLESQGNAMVDRLAAGLKADYSALKASGAGKTEFVKLATSYNGRAKAMESSMDSSVNALISQMKQDLKAAGVPDSEIKSYVDKYKNEYNLRKEARRDAIFGQAKNFL